MARHTKPRDQRHRGAPLKRAAALPSGSWLRSGVWGVMIVLCLIGCIKALASASAAGSAHIDSLGRWPEAALLPQVTRHPRKPAHDGSSGLATPPGPQRLTGQAVTAVGDSIMVASTPALRQALPGIQIDAVVGRQFRTGLAIIAGLRARGLLRPIVIVGLGTNGPVTAGQISQLFAEIGPDRRLVLVNTFEARPWEHEVNAIFAAAVADHPGVVLADWHSAIEHRTRLLWPDDIHPLPAGGIVYARVLKAAIEHLVNLAG